MRRIAFALVLMIASGWGAPARAQWWGGGWERPCFGACRPWPAIGGGGRWWPGRFVVLRGYAPRQAWDTPGAYAAGDFRPDAWGWRRMMWRREMRRRRFEAWSRWAGAGREAAPPEAPRPPVHSWARRWSRWLHPLPGRAVARRSIPDERPAPVHAEAAVAMMPAGKLRQVQPKVREAIPIRLTAAAMLRRFPEQAVRPAAMPAASGPPRDAAMRRPHRAASVRPTMQPVALKSQPAATPLPRPSAPPVVSVAVPAAQVPIPTRASPADVPVAPLD